MIRYLEITRPSEPDALDIHPRGAVNTCYLPPVISDACVYTATIAACGIRYRICGRCGTVRIDEPRP